MPCPSPCPAQPLVPRNLCSPSPLPSASLSLAAAHDWTYPFVSVLHGEKKAVFWGMFKKSSQTHTGLTQKGKKTTQTQNPHLKTTINISQVQTRRSTYACPVICWWKNMMYFISSYSSRETKDNVSQIRGITLWEGARSAMREHESASAIADPVISSVQW